ncbi:MAG: hypothetical protein AAGI03_02235 [Pseudomonadota bacterium]
MNRPGFPGDQSKIVIDHWAQYGRDDYSRHDYERLDKVSAEDLMDALRVQLPDLPGRQVAGLVVTSASSFAYSDPVDNSTVERQGLRILFGDMARLVFRLSGTGTTGATLRVYLERHEPDPSAQIGDTQKALGQVIRAAETLAGIRRRLGRDAPDVIT